MLIYATDKSAAGGVTCTQFQWYFITDARLLFEIGHPYSIFVNRLRYIFIFGRFAAEGGSIFT